MTHWKRCQSSSAVDALIAAIILISAAKRQPTPNEHFPGKRVSETD
jgi:hypothetical protein